jgi:hypothetical protein
MDLLEILKHLSIPRPNQSEALSETANYIKALLTNSGIPFVIQEFTLRPYMQLILGITAVLLAALLFLCIYKRWPVPALITALALPIILFVEFEGFVPLVTSIITRTGENIIINFNVPNPARELVFAAHYDSKTDFFDHIQRSRIYAFIPLAFILGLGLAIFTFFSKRNAMLRKKIVTTITLIIAGSLIVFWGLVFLGFGGYIFLPANQQSYGSVDDGASVAALLALSKDIKDGKVNIGHSNVTVVLTSGEEVTLQGADAYVKERFGRGSKPPLPTSMVNLELIGQNGTMTYWKKDGVFFIYYDADPELVSRLGKAWNSESGLVMESRERLTDDGQRFMAAGIPAVTISNSGLPGLGETAFHSTRDDLARIKIDNLKLMIGTLKRYIEGYNTR